MPSPPLRLNRRRFLGCSAAAGLALSQGVEVEAAAIAGRPVRVGLIGLGSRGTSLLRALLELPEAEVVALADVEPRHLARASGIVERAGRPRPETTESASRLLARDDVDAVVVALPCDLHAATYVDALDAGKHLYAEKPLAHTVEGCDRVIAASSRHPDLAVHVGFQRRSHPRYVEASELIRRGELGQLYQADATWISSNGPVNGHGGWMARRERSGDWMVEQAVHVWDVLHWLVGGPPVRAWGRGRRDLFCEVQPDRDVTDHYSVHLEWADGFGASFLQNWASPADDAFTGTTLRLFGTSGGLDLSSGSATFRDRSRPRRSIHPGPQPDTRLALAAFLAATRAPSTTPPPIRLAEARDATLTGLLARAAVDAGRVVEMSEILAVGPGPSA